MFRVRDYLKRIQCDDLLDSPRLCFDDLKRLHESHLLNIPFENFNMALNRKVEMNLDDMFEKCIKNLRGGFCFELNNLFAWLLAQLGYNLKLVGSRVYKQLEHSYGPWLSHVVILVDLDNTTYLLDVGFSGSFRSPLKLAVNEEQLDFTGSMKLEFNEEDSVYTLMRSNTEIKDHKPVYQFTSKPREVHEFEPMLDWVQSVDCPRFYNRSICIKHFSNGVYMLVAYRFTKIIYENGIELSREDKELNQAEYHEYLRSLFNISIEQTFEPRHLDL